MNTGQLSNLITIDPKIMSGTPCFAGTRVPIQVLLDHLEAGQLDEFYMDFPTVKKEQVKALIAVVIS